jgi:hypothetical protein
MIDAQPDGAHMHYALYRRTIDFAKKMDGIAMLSGGEPTEHPQILKMIRYALRKQLITVVLSNGLFLHDRAKTNQYLNLGALWQVTNDPRYYPKAIPQIEHPNLVIERRIRGELIGLGRTSSLGGKEAPGCFNLRSCICHGFNLRQAIDHLRRAGKFCTPSINVDGTLAAGESNQCYRAGRIDDPQCRLIANLRDHACDRCQLHQRLDARHLRAIGRG